MKFIDDFMEKKAQDALKKENEHFERKARLSELESKNKQKGRNLLHPVKSANERKEIKNLRKEIAAYEKEKEDKKSILVLGGVLIGLLAVFILIGVFDKTPDKPVTDETTVSVTSDEPKNESTVQENTIAVTAATTTDEQPNTASSIDNSIVAGAGASEENTKPVEQDEKVEQEVTGAEDELEASDATAVQGIMSSDIRVSSLTDYAHFSNDTICLGNNEGVFITIEAVNKKMEMEDVVFDYDTSLLNVDVEEPKHKDEKTIISAYVTANEECSTELFITTKYEIETLGEDNAYGYPISIKKLDSSEGRIVFITPTGTKYHYDAGCAGENAIKTTYHDVAMYEYEPCGTCVN